jgi:hypothetical protein
MKLTEDGWVWFRLSRTARITLDDWADARIGMTENEAKDLRDDLVRVLGDG